MYHRIDLCMNICLKNKNKSQLFALGLDLIENAYKKRKNENLKKQKNSFLGKKVPCSRFKDRHTDRYTDTHNYY